MNKVAMSLAVQDACRAKFKGRQTLMPRTPMHFPENRAREYTRVCNTYLTLLNKTLAEHLPTIRRAIDMERAGMRTDGVLDVIAEVFATIQTVFNQRATAFGLERKLGGIANMTRKMSVRQWKNVVRNTLGVNIFEDYFMGEFFRGALTEWTTRNIGLIKSIPQTTLTEMRSIVQNGWQNGLSNTVIGQQIQEAYSASRKKAQFWARDQTAKLNSKLTQAQQKDAGVNEYIWSDSNDERVRDRHEYLSGKKFRWDDPPVVDTKTGRRAHPGEDYNCRCVALPVFNLPGLSLPWEGGANE